MPVANTTLDLFDHAIDYSRLIKQCNVCKERKPYTDFYQEVVRQGPDKGKKRHQHRCKACKKAAAAKYREANRDVIRQKKRDHDASEAGKEYRRQERVKARAKGTNYSPKQKAQIAKYQITKGWARELKRMDKAGRLTEMQAWKDWLENHASDDWLDHYYTNILNPWRDHRLTAAEQTMMRYRLDSAFNCQMRMTKLLRQYAKDRTNHLSKTFGYTGKDICARLEQTFTEGMTWQKFHDGEIHIDHIIPKAYFDHSIDEEVIDCWSLNNLQALWAFDNRAKGNRYVEVNAVCPHLLRKYADRISDLV